MGHLLDSQRVHFTGFLPKEHYRTVLQVSKVHVYLTYPFLLSWSMLDAMACGALVIGSDTGPVAEIIHNGKNGLTVPFFDTDVLAQKVVSHLEGDVKGTSTMKRSAQKLIQKEFDKKVCVENLLNFITR